MTRPRVMIIAGGEWQLPLIQKARTMGAFVVNTNLYPESPGFRHADLGLVADVLDRPKNLHYARENHVDAVLTDQSDIAVPTVAYVGEQLGVPNIGSAMAERFTNKTHMRRICSEQGFPTPKFKLCRDLAEAAEFTKDNEFPIVVKPPANQSSRGVAKVESMRDLQSLFATAQSQSSDGTVLLEGYIGGTELTVDGLKLNSGRHYCLATSFKTHYAHNTMVASQLWFSHRNPQIDYQALHEQHNQLVEAMGLSFGLTHAEYKYHDGRFYLIEVAARGGGTRISSDIVPLMSGVDSNALLIRMALGENIRSINGQFARLESVLDFFEFAPGKVKAIEGVEEVALLPGVCSIGMNIHPGREIRPASDDRSRHGYIIAHAECAEDLRTLLVTARKLVRVQFE